MTSLIASSVIIGLGVYGILVRRDLVGVLVAIEIMMGGLLLLFTSIAPSGPATPQTHAVALIVLVIAACEASIGLALVVAVAKRNRTSRIDELTEVRG